MSTNNSMDNCKRKDNKGRLLHNGEVQRKDGRYEYRYNDILGKRQSVYSWKLVDTDRQPSGKKNSPSLRSQEKEIQRELDDQINGDNTTVYEIVKEYVEIRSLKYHTNYAYNTIIHRLEKEDFGKRKISEIKVSDAMEWIGYLQKECKLKYSTISNIRNLVRPAFKLAVDDNKIRKNPFDFKIKDVIINDVIPKDALTQEEEQEFLEFIRLDLFYHKYYDAMYLFLNTGLRAAEMSGLTIDDIDIEKKRINVARQLHKIHNTNQYAITKPKSESGTRVLPISSDVCECVNRIITYREPLEVEPVIDGYSGFLFINSDGNPLIPSTFGEVITRVVNKYNKCHDDELPNITPHILRHTFCSKMANAGMSPKNLQYIMGHKNWNITMNRYAHVLFENAEEDYRKIVKCKTNDHLW